MGIPHVDVLLFVGVAVAWAVYLIPKAIQHHEQAARTRSVDRFSHRVRVLARREPVSAREAELVASGVASGATSPATSSLIAASTTSVPALGPSPVERRTADVSATGRTREATRRATQRRRRVLAVLLLAVAGVAGAAGYGLLDWAWVGVPAGLVVAWLVIARVTVKRERARLRPRSERASSHDQPTDSVAGEPLAHEETTEIARVSVTVDGMWDPVPVTLPTYVDKPAATRTVRGIDLDADGVWTSGRTDADAALARRADAEAAAARAAREVDSGAPGEYGDRAAGAAG